MGFKGDGLRGRGPRGSASGRGLRVCVREQGASNVCTYENNTVTCNETSRVAAI